MTFARVKPGGYGVGGKVASSEMNQLDIDHAGALDKSGDTITGGTFHIDGATIFMGAGAAISISGSAGIICQDATCIIANATAAIQSEAVGGIQAQIAKGITDGGFASGIAATIAAGISDGGIAGGLATTVPGGLNLGGGSSDWITFPARAVVIALPLTPLGPATGWTTAQGCVVGPATTQSLFCALPRLPPGSTLNSVTCAIKVAGPHSGGVPGTLPTLKVYSFSLAPGFTPTQTFLKASHSFPFPTPGSGTAWDASGNIQTWTYVCDQNNTSLDTTQTCYYLELIDENGVNAVSGNEYFGIEMSINVTQLRIV